MATQKAVHIAIDQFLVAQLAGVPCVFDNQDDTELSKGTVSFIKQKVHFKNDKQHELGNVTSRKIDGIVVIILNIRKGAGAADRDDLYNNVVKSFRSQIIGGATFLDPQAVASGNTDNWNLTGWQIPFYFYEP